MGDIKMCWLRVLVVLVSAALALNTVDAFGVGVYGVSSLTRSAHVNERVVSRGGDRLRPPAAALRMGFLGWDLAGDVGGKGIRDILGIISCEASHILAKGEGSAERIMS